MKLIMYLELEIVLGLDTITNHLNQGMENVLCVKTLTGGFSLNTCKKAYENIEAYTYIAASEYGKIVKIGYSKNIKDREISLNKKDKYGGFSDWQIVYYLKSNKTNKLETETLKNTYCYNFPCQYYKGSKLQTGYEARSCNYKTIKSALEIAKEEVKKIYSDTVFIETWEIPNAEQLFNFENLGNTAKR